MRNETRVLFNAFTQAIAELNGVPSATQKFNVSPSVQQRLITRQQESAALLSLISMITVTEQSGEAIGLGVSGPIAGTTNTTTTDRETRDVGNLDANPYACTQTNFDTHIRYAQLDAWAKFPDFQARLRDAIVLRQALDRILIGFNGTSRAPTSNRATNPLLQDVNIGWLQKYRTNAPARVLADGASTGTGVKVGEAAGNDYKNLDQLVFDVRNNLIAPWFRDDPRLRVMVGTDLLADKYFPLIGDNKPTEKVAADLIVSQRRIGGLQAVAVPFFPAGTIMVSMPENLAIYEQEGSRRRHIEDNAKRDRIENFESVNEAYVIEDYSAGCVVENIQLVA